MEAGRVGFLGERSITPRRLPLLANAEVLSQSPRRDESNADS
jgi:hypothetical protein